MPSGDSQRAWFPEMLAELETFWTSNVDWQSLIAFCEKMTKVRAELRSSRGVRDPMIYCHSCKERHPAKLLDISPRSALFSLQKLGILTEDQMKTLDRDWAKYRSKHELDACGKPKSTTTQTSPHCSDDISMALKVK